MKAKVIDIKGKEIKDIDLNDEIFNIKPNRYAIYEAIKNELANKRQGTHSTKTKAEVSGSGAKPHKQKGTGRARVWNKKKSGLVPWWYRIRDQNREIILMYCRKKSRDLLSNQYSL